MGLTAFNRMRNIQKEKAKSEEIKEEKPIELKNGTEVVFSYRNNNIDYTLFDDQRNYNIHITQNELPAVISAILSETQTLFLEEEQITPFNFALHGDTNVIKVKEKDTHDLIYKFTVVVTESNFNEKTEKEKIEEEKIKKIEEEEKTDAEKLMKKGKK